MSTVLSRATFSMGVTRLSRLPPDTGVEVAFAGRSNAGKSSAINRLVGARALARTSKTPGRTREINFFDLGAGRRLVDLPGYGYARVSKSMQQHWGSLVSGYLAGRRSLRGVIVLMDIRRPLTTLDEQLIGWCHAAGLPVHGLLTKCDKLGRGRGLRSLREARARLGSPVGEVSLQRFSALDGTGLDEARERVERWLEEKKTPASQSGGRGKAGGE